MAADNETKAHMHMLPHVHPSRPVRPAYREQWFCRRRSRRWPFFPAPTSCPFPSTVTLSGVRGWHSCRRYANTTRKVSQSTHDFQAASYDALRYRASNGHIPTPQVTHSKTSSERYAYNGVCVLRFEQRRRWTVNHRTCCRCQSGICLNCARVGC